jgi:hypothetical protein
VVPSPVGRQTSAIWFFEPLQAMRKSKRLMRSGLRKWFQKSSAA